MSSSERRSREVIRDLARRVAELANSKAYEARRRRWRDVNALRRPDRAPVWCRPVGAWKELLPETDLAAEEPFLRNVERRLRQDLIKHEIGDDSLIDPWWSVPAVLELQGQHRWGVPIKHIPPDTPAGAWKYDPPLKTEADFDRLTWPTYAYNHAKTQDALSRADELLGDILPVRLTCHVPLGAALGAAAANLRGLEQLMWDMADRPALVHRLMRHLMKGTLRAQRALERSGLLTLNNTGPMFCGDPIQGAGERGRIRLKDLWLSAESQEFDQVSPVMWEEFLLNYQMPILSQFGLTSYGCCENLTHKIGGVLKIPNLRIFVSSAWTDLEKVAEAVGNRYTIMWRQKASDVIFARDLAPVRQHLERGMRVLKGCHVQIVLRELQTLNGKPDRLAEWAQVAKDVAASCA